MVESLILLGLATDGPPGTILRPTTLEEARGIYGGFYNQKVSVTPSITGLTLHYEPLGLVSHGFNDKTIALYRPRANNSTLLEFGNIGDYGTHLCDIKYQPYLGKSDMLAALEHIYTLTGKIPYTLRLGGSPSKLTVQGWVFESAIIGLGGNYATVTGTSSSLTFSSSVGNYSPVTYSLANHRRASELINKDYEAGISPVRVVSYGNSTLTPFTSSLSGGSDGSVNTTHFENALNSFIPYDGFCVICLGEATSSLIDASIAHNNDQYTRPKVFYFPTMQHTDTMAEDVASAYPARSPWIGLILGNSIASIGGDFKERYLVESLIPYLESSRAHTLTNIGLPVVNVTPMLGVDWLTALSNAGVMGPTRFLSKGIGIYKSVMSDGVTRQQESHLGAKILAQTAQYLKRYIGQVLPEGVQPIPQRDLLNILGSFASIDHVDVTVYRNTYFTNNGSKIFNAAMSMVAHVSFKVADEIISISTEIQLA